MTPRKFSKREAIRFGWDTVKRHLGFFILIYLVYGVVIYVPALVIGFTKPQGIQWVFMILIRIALAIVALVVALGFIKVGLKFCDNEEAKVAHLFGASFSQIINWLFASIIGGIIVTVGFVLLLIPGIIWSIRLSQASYLIVDRRLGAVAALKESWALTKDSTWNLFLFGSLLFLVNMVGALALGIGLLLTIPTTLIAHAFVYRKLLAAQAGSLSPAPA